jgi:hypothetical protein
MKLATVLLFAAMVYATSVSQETQSTGANSTAVTNTQDEIKKLEEMRNQAVLHGDVAVLDRLTSDDYTFITLKGSQGVRCRKGWRTEETIVGTIGSRECTSSRKTVGSALRCRQP